MPIATQLLRACLWLSVLGMSLWVGGTVYQMLVIGPIWTASPPESLRAFLNNTIWSKTIYNFFGPPYMAARFLPIVAALVLAWNRPAHRAYLLVATIVMVAMIIVTRFYIYPINDRLFVHPPPDAAADQTRRTLYHWIWVDRLRFGVGLVAYLSLLRAFQLPLD